MTKTNSFDFEGSQAKLDTLMPTLNQMRDTEVRMFNLGVPNAIALAMKVYKSFAQDRARFEATFKPAAFNPADYDDFPTRVGALWHADVMLQQATDPKGNLQELLEETKPLHKKLAKAAVYLWLDDADLAPVIAAIREGSGHMDRADDLARYAALFTQNWTAAKGNSNVSMEDIKAARRLSAKLLDAMTTASAGNVAELRDIRNRAAEYLRRAVDDIRDGAEYIFRNDLESLERYPSLFASKGRRKTAPATTDVIPAATVDEEEAPTTPATAV